jgi:hypothetical protein|nr:MAG TPA: hypothetical protein [Caudoviricetes sp.]
MENEKKDPRLSDEVVKLQKHRIMLWCAIIIITFFLIVQFSVANCENKVLADQFTFASTISSIILSVIAIIMSVVSGESINNLLHKFRDVHDEISDVPGKIDSSIQKMDDSSGKFKEVYSNLKDIPQQIEKNTEIMKDVSRDVNESISHLSELLSDIQDKTDKLDSIEMSIKMMKDQFFNAVPRDNEFSKDLGLTEKQTEQIITTGSLSGGLMLYAIKLAKDNKKLLSLSNLASALKIAGTYDYFYGYYVAMTAIGMVTCKLDPNNMLKVQEYDKSLNTLQEKLTQRVANDPDLENQFKLVDEFIDKSPSVTVK